MTEERRQQILAAHRTTATQFHDTLTKLAAGASDAPEKEEKSSDEEKKKQ